MTARALDHAGMGGFGGSGAWNSAARNSGDGTKMAFRLLEWEETVLLAFRLGGIADNLRFFRVNHRAFLMACNKYSRHG